MQSVAGVAKPEISTGNHNNWRVGSMVLKLSVLVDFTSTILSVLSDGALVAVAVTLVWLIFKTASKDQ